MLLQRHERKLIRSEFVHEGHGIVREEWKLALEILDHSLFGIPLVDVLLEALHIFLVSSDANAEDVLQSGLEDG